MTNSSKLIGWGVAALAVGCAASTELVRAQNMGHGPGQNSSQASGQVAAANPGYTPTQNAVMSKVAPIKPSPADEALSAYIDRVHGDYRVDTPTPGSLWLPNGRLVELSTDFKARHLHDVISVVVSESLSAETDGTVKNQRASSMSSAISSLFGSLALNNRLQNLLNATAASALTAQGQSVSNSSLSTILGGEVVDVLPNGMLVIQAVRQVTFSQQTQTIRLRGVVRPQDISAGNQVQSAAITNLELEVLGKGIINDYTYRPNVIVRLLQRLLVF
jgi:flagellar L-ring protein precursor FlgH